MNNKFTKSANKSPIRSLIAVLFSILVIASNFVIYTYLKRVNKYCDESCVASKHYLNKLIRGVLAYNFSISLLVILLNLIDRNIIKKQIPKSILLLVGLIQLVFNGILMIGFFIYYKRIHTESCNCLTTNEISGMHKYLGVWRYFLIIMYSIALTIPLILLFSKLM